MNCRRIVAIEAIEFGAFPTPLLTTDTLTGTGIFPKAMIEGGGCVF